MSKMNKAELYTLAKQQKEELMTASLFNNSLEEENSKNLSDLIQNGKAYEFIILNHEEEIEKLQEQIKQMVCDFDSDEKNIYYKKLEEDNENLKKQVSQKTKVFESLVSRQLELIEELQELKHKNIIEKYD
tara:strand:+ start:117 stop:509 length:393 start_codon:yes stop_codon:yes gene_type:complete